MTIQNIGVLGVGGVGGYFGGKLCQLQQHDPAVTVSFIARGAHLRAIQAAGLQLRIETDGDLVCRPTRVELFTDSVYVGKGLSEYMPKWKANGWRRKEGTKFVPLKNEELWRRLDDLTTTHTVKYTRVAGHSGHAENDRVDELAVAAYQRFL